MPNEAGEELCVFVIFKFFSNDFGYGQNIKYIIVYLEFLLLVYKRSHIPISHYLYIRTNQKGIEILFCQVNVNEKSFFLNDFTDFFALLQGCTT